MANQLIAVSKIQQFIVATVALAGSTLAMTSSATAITLKVTVDNLAPTNGNFLTQVWVGFHDGTFDTYTGGEPLPDERVERLVEDGLTGPISGFFSESGAGVVQGTVRGDSLPAAVAPIAPGRSASLILNIDDSLISTSQYFSYASMIIPSNDAFIANGNPLAHQIFDQNGNFIRTSFIVPGSAVNDAGTEVNDESTTNTAFFGQATPNTGTTEGGVVTTHPGFIPGGPILSDPRFANADFTAPGYQVARVTVEQVPEPSTLVLLPLTGVFLLYRRVRRHLALKS